MPSPVGHTLAGCCVAALAARTPGLRSAGFVGAVVAAANLPDVDFAGALLRPLGVALAHQGPTHSLAFVLAATLPLALLARGRVPLLRAWAWLCAAAASHLLFDFLSHDPAPPVGLPLLWPLSDALLHAPVPLFPRTDRFNPLSLANVFALVVELAWTLPPLALALRQRPAAAHARAGRPAEARRGI